MDMYVIALMLSPLLKELLARLRGRSHSFTKYPNPAANPTSHKASDYIKNSTGIVGRESLERLRSPASTPGSSLSRSMTLESHVIGRPARYGLPHVGSEVCSVEKSGVGLGGARY
ncbi:hypothetical protein KIW84_072600 [Lathyrus oleraceus]|uniref:Uncharacterized protein n=1 Tax=Pisum sativum TaxID=3888 RepID=A0A9D4VNU8_PEA|nr:hypothetical protein KIW84_072600 [Pisum sativum]